ncbi:MAG: nucleotide pyrophosphohydrolase [Lentisphaeria bacterium]|nr:nucleotide pyrophosphohydrolase [Lentisphaeria bacterium]
MSEIIELRNQLRAFSEEREWEQFHTPKNLSMALSVEVSELVEHFQWLTEEESLRIMDLKNTEICDELADIFLYLIRLSDILNVDLIEASKQKIIKNRDKYPANLVRGKANKYTDYEK